MQLLSEVSDAQVRQARRNLIDHGEVATKLLSDTVARSWLRCRSAGLEPLQQPCDSALVHADHLRQVLDEQREFLSYARPVMNFLHDQMRGSRSLVALADTRAMMLHALIEEDFAPRADRISLIPGTLWAEDQRGTNAMGTALVDNRGTVIHAGEHFLESNGFLTCAAAPVINSVGKTMGVLNISSDYRNHHPHTFALVRCAASMIQDRLFNSQHARHVRLRFHPQAEGLGSVGEGLLAITEDGWIIGANAMATRWLRLNPQSLGAVTVEEVFGRRLGSLLQVADRRDGQQGRRLSLPGLAEHAAVFMCADLPVQPASSIRKAGQAATWLHPSPGDRANLAARSAQLQFDSTAAPTLKACPTEDSQLTAARTRAKRALAHSIALLLQGESGSGKEVFAHELHAAGPRAAKPFVAVNCAALPEALIEAELFGYVGGAFTGARRDGSAGRIREADGGTLFLDEIGDMPMAMQARLLRVLQERRVIPLGSGRPYEVDFMLVCATHRNLRDEVRAGRFREDLYYRVNGLALTLPALRDRTDFGDVVAQMLKEIAPGLAVHLAPDLAAALRQHRWPGNLRQLRNVLTAAHAMLDPGEATIHWAHMPPDLLAEIKELADEAQPRHALDLTAVTTGQATLRRVSELTITQVIDATQGNLSEAARRLGISRNTLYRHLRRQP